MATNNMNDKIDNENILNDNNEISSIDYAEVEDNDLESVDYEEIKQLLKAAEPDQYETILSSVDLTNFSEHQLKELEKITKIAISDKTKEVQARSKVVTFLDVSLAILDLSSVEQLAKLINVSARTIYNWKSSKLIPKAQEDLIYELMKNKVAAQLREEIIDEKERDLGVKSFFIVDNLQEILFTKKANPNDYRLKTIKLPIAMFPQDYLSETYAFQLDKNISSGIFKRDDWILINKGKYTHKGYYLIYNKREYFIKYVEELPFSESTTSRVLRVYDSENSEVYSDTYYVKFCNNCIGKILMHSKNLDF